ncbi:hypothetical protein C8N26_1610 [Tenacibaculum lutimaris]|uniref:Uncharacterized protein n=1 Tax=Tenacibaculum lutimaris TaxID=285258 RepID=A0A420E1M3_9FLAO|nr:MULTISPECIES: hypothetical protein [Tenacibaculum]RKF03978.1 hypothetical protein C8N26_1610 [Tenacibaculum lutimaris]
MRKKDELIESYDIKSWQSLHVKQLSYVRNLFIFISTALTGFISSLIFSDKQLSFFVNILLKISAIGYIIPISIGIWIAINESKNYRLKYKISRIVKRFEQPSENPEFKKIEAECTCLENMNKFLFKSQLLTFLGAFLVLLIALSLKS